MQEHGRVVFLYPVREGVSTRTGEVWKAQDFVIEIDGRYTRKVRLSMFGTERVAKANIQLGEYITALFEIEAHEHNGEFYNDLRVYDIQKNGMSVFRQQ